MTVVVTPAAAQQLLAQLVSIDSVNPTLVSGGAGEAEMARFVAAWLDRHALNRDLRGDLAGILLHD